MRKRLRTSSLRWDRSCNCHRHCRPLARYRSPSERPACRPSSTSPSSAGIALSVWIFAPSGRYAHGLPRPPAWPIGAGTRSSRPRRPGHHRLRPLAADGASRSHLCPVIIVVRHGGDELGLRASRIADIVYPVDDEYWVAAVPQLRFAGSFGTTAEWRRY